MRVTLRQYTITFARGMTAGVGLAAGLALTALLAQTATAWTGGETLTSAKLNAVVTDLGTLFGDARWTKNGANAGYTAGNVGVGTTTPGVKVHAFSSAGNDGVRATHNTGGSIEMYHGAARGVLQTLGATDIQIRTNNAQDIMWLQHSTGNVGIGTTSPGDRLQVNGTLRVQGGVVFSLNPTSAQVGTSSAHDLQLMANGTTRITVNATTGNAAFSTTSGTCTINGTGACSSDARLKTDVSPIEGSLARLERLHGVYFRWKKRYDGSDRHMGFLAQEVESVFPELVTRLPNRDEKLLNMTGLTAPLVEAVKELNASDRKLSARLDVLAAENVALRRMVDESNRKLARIERSLAKRDGSAKPEVAAEPRHSAPAAAEPGESGILRRALRWLW